jgi:hypothetical protein
MEGGIVVEKVKGLKAIVGFNAEAEEYEDMVKAALSIPPRLHVLLFRMRIGSRVAYLPQRS